MEHGDIARLDDELDAPLTLAEVEEDEAFWADLNSPLVVREDELTERERYWIENMGGPDNGGTS